MIISPPLESLLRPLFRIQTIIWGAMTTGKLIYLGLVVFLVKAKTIPEIALPGYLPPVFGVVGTLLAVTSIILWRSWNSSEAIQAAMKAVVIPGPDSSSSQDQGSPNRRLPDGFGALAEPEKRVFLVFQDLMRRMIICLAMNDVLAAFGLVTGLCTQQLGQAVPFILAAILANVFIFPRPQASINEISASESRS